MKNVLHFIESCENPDQRAIMEHLHQMLTSLPGVTAALKFKIPFYYCHSWICYLNPEKKGGVELAFTRANELSNEQGLLDFRGRKQVGGIVFQKTKDIPEEAVLEIVQEALLLDEEVPYASKRKGR
jgi:hypothetical protein